MKRNRRVIFLIAAILSCAFPLLWSSMELTPLAAKVGWLVLGCLIGLGTPLQLPELLLLAAILTPGLFITLTTHGDLNTLQSYRSVGHVVFTLGLYAALIGLSELLKSTTLRLLLRICLFLAIPLSFAQRRLWFLDQLKPGSPVYNIPIALQMTGCLNITALYQACNEIVHRHQVLQMVYGTLDDEPVLTFHPDPSLALAVVDLDALLPDEQTARVQQLTREEAQRPFNLTSDLPIRVVLLRLDLTR